MIFQISYTAIIELLPIQFSNVNVKTYICHYLDSQNDIEYSCRVNRLYQHIILNISMLKTAYQLHFIIQLLIIVTLYMTSFNCQDVLQVVKLLILIV